MNRPERLPLRLRLRLWLRLLILQASWNPQRMQNLGFLYCLLGWYKRLDEVADDRRHFFYRYFGFFNTNPYLAGFLVGGLTRLEAENRDNSGVSSQVLVTYRDSLARAFASLGDQLFWLGLKPALTLIACVLALAGNVAGALGVFGMFLVCQLALRWWSLEAGYRRGLDILDLLDNPIWHRLILVAKRVSLVAAGLVAGMFLAGTWSEGSAACAILFGTGLVLGAVVPRLSKRRLPGEVLMLIGVAVCLGLGFAISLPGG
ncbi:hypothetical protein COW53_01685 [bacterium CG17_big_fil_post_rev_8_21_14_2_50_64_8]|nr:MAG: hypothetical protein COW53_01685 [bacterium CG17_big_fil_post_rev_8_21_14_2_50_64_8]PJA76173.1 MAG: hypothetical protein CO151_03485 [bacterium CG_4_9_14_3_um_filter_65_15]